MEESFHESRIIQLNVENVAKMDLLYISIRNDTVIYNANRIIYLFPILMPMKKFLLRLILFIIVAYLVAIIIDIITSKGLQRVPKNHLETLNTIMHDTLNNDVLILGNSRGTCAYNPLYLDSILSCNSRNISISGQTYIVSNLRYRIYRRNNPTPKLLILNIDHIELGSGTLGFERYQYFPYIQDTLIQEILDSHYFTWMDQYIPMWRYQGNYKYVGLGVLDFFGIYHTNGKQYKGWSKNVGTFDGTNMRNLLATDREIKCSIYDSTLIAFEQLLQQAEFERTNTVMVYSPVYYIAQENMSTYFDTIMSTYQELSEKYNIPILDYRTLPMNYDSTYFVDATHLNYIGAREFSIELAHDIDSLGLLKN